MKIYYQNLIFFHKNRLLIQHVIFVWYLIGSFHGTRRRSNEHHKPRSGKKVDSSSFAVMAYEATIHSGV